MKTPCYVCEKEMVIDEPGGEAYHTDAQFNKDGTVKEVPYDKRKIRHETCKGD